MTYEQQKNNVRQLCHDIEWFADAIDDILYIAVHIDELDLAQTRLEALSELIEEVYEHIKKNRKDLGE